MTNALQPTTATATGLIEHFDAIVIGAGVSGLYQLYCLRQLGLAVRCYEDGSGVGGTWYWNRYPGCRFDSESETYGYSFSEELLQEWDWKEHYSGQPENERYLNYVADKFDLRRDIQFNARVKSAVYDEKANRWEVQLESGRRAQAQFLIGAVGVLSAHYVPDIAGIDSFTGASYHTSRWPKEHTNFTGKRVAVIGTGATAVQLIPVACIPMDTPAEALAELEVVVNQLGLKALMLTSLLRRPVEAAQKDGVTNRYATWLDTLGLDSQYDYDPVWAKCVELKVTPTFHTASQGVGARTTYSNFVYNHIGHFAASGEAVCKSLFLNGVTRRFPTLKFAFLEGGVGWACTLYSDLIGHWKKRNVQALDNTNPANLDLNMMADYFRRYGADSLTTHIDQLDSMCHLLAGVEAVDDFARCEIMHPTDIRDLFVPNFYFGCEPDDPINAWAFRAEANPFNAKLHAIMGSDIGHFDCVDMADVLTEAHELVDKKLLTEDDFRDFVFGNSVRLWGGANPDFFKGTAIEKRAADYLYAVHAEEKMKGVN